MITRRTLFQFIFLLFRQRAVLYHSVVNTCNLSRTTRALSLYNQQKGKMTDTNLSTPCSRDRLFKVAKQNPTHRLVKCKVLKEPVNGFVKSCEVLRGKSSSRLMSSVVAGGGCAEHCDVQVGLRKSSEVKVICDKPTAHFVVVSRG